MIAQTSGYVMPRKMSPYLIVGVVAASLVVRTAAGITNRAQLEIRVASLCSAEVAADWDTWYAHIAPETREELRLEQFREDSNTRDFTVVSWKIRKIERLKPPPGVEAAAKVAMEVWVQRGSGPVEQEEEQTDYWVWVDDNWFWYWRGWPDD